MSKFSIQIEDDEDIVTICGVKYTKGLFGQLGVAPVGVSFKIVAREDGVLTLCRGDHTPPHSSQVSPKRFEHDLYDREDGLSHCKVCGGAEGSLPTLCPERAMTAEESDAVYAGKLNFADGPMDRPKWWHASTNKKPS